MLVYVISRSRAQTKAIRVPVPKHRFLPIPRVAAREAALWRLVAAGALGLLLCTSADARYPSERILWAKGGARLPAAASRFLPATPGVVTGPARPGYVHFFELTAPDGETETQVGIETEDGRIAWSFPGVGAVVAAFPSGDGNEVGPMGYRIRHRYGIRPFHDDARMAALQQSLPQRVSALVDDAIVYCNEPEGRDRFCMSCLGFVLQVLFPGPHPTPARLPPGFMRTAAHAYYTTDDMLLYLMGVEALPTREARVERIRNMRLPEALREDLLELALEIDPSERVGSSRAAATDIVPSVPKSSRRGKGAGARAGPRRL